MKNLKISLCDLIGTQYCGAMVEVSPFISGLSQDEVMNKAQSKVEFIYLMPLKNNVFWDQLGQKIAVKLVSQLRLNGLKTNPVVITSSFPTNPFPAVICFYSSQNGTDDSPPLLSVSKNRL